MYIFLSIFRQLCLLWWVELNQVFYADMDRLNLIITIFTYGHASCKSERAGIC